MYVLPFSLHLPFSHKSSNRNVTIRGAFSFCIGEYWTHIREFFFVCKFYCVTTCLHIVTQMCCPSGKLQNHKWENAMTVDKLSWGYRRNADIMDYLTIEELLYQLVSTVRLGNKYTVSRISAPISPSRS